MEVVIEAADKAIEKPRQDALLPTIALILFGFVSSTGLCPSSMPHRPETPKGHTKGT